MCGTGPKWKREEVADHKFDFVDIDQFASKSIFRKFMYSFVFIFVIKSVLINASDLTTAILLVASDGWSSDIKPTSPPLTVSRWIFVASIIVSYLLLLLELRKTIRVIRSRDIAYSYTCIGAYRFYSVRSYPHYCLFSKIGDTKTWKNFFAFFCFFSFKGWKRFLFAEAPRQVINAITLSSVYVTKGSFHPTAFWDTASGSLNNRFTIALMSFSFVLWAISAIKLVISFFIYIPLLCSIRGNLKEYVCHKIDKRIAKLLKTKSKNRILQERREQRRLEAEMRRANGDRPGTHALPHVRQATLPAISLEDDLVEYSRPFQGNGQVKEEGWGYGGETGVYDPSKSSYQGGGGDGRGEGRSIYYPSDGAPPSLSRPAFGPEEKDVYMSTPSHGGHETGAMISTPSSFPFPPPQDGSMTHMNPGYGAGGGDLTAYSPSPSLGTPSTYPHTSSMPGGGGSPRLGPRTQQNWNEGDGEERYETIRPQPSFAADMTNPSRNSTPPPPPLGGGATPPLNPLYYPQGNGTPTMISRPLPPPPGPPSIATASSLGGGSNQGHPRLHHHPSTSTATTAYNSIDGHGSTRYGDDGQGGGGGGGGGDTGSIVSEGTYHGRPYHPSVRTTTTAATGSPGLHPSSMGVMVEEGAERYADDLPSSPVTPYYHPRYDPVAGRTRSPVIPPGVGPEVRSSSPISSSSTSSPRPSGGGGGGYRGPSSGRPY